MSPQYILDETGNPVPEPDFKAWGRWMATANRHVGKDDIDGVRVSTVFLGIDHQWAHDPPPVLWESMVFVDGVDLAEKFPSLEQRRYTSREAAERGHADLVAEVRRLLPFIKSEGAPPETPSGGAGDE